MSDALTTSVSHEAKDRKSKRYIKAGQHGGLSPLEETRLEVFFAAMDFPVLLDEDDVWSALTLADDVIGFSARALRAARCGERFDGDAFLRLCPVGIYPDAVPRVVSPIYHELATARTAVRLLLGQLSSTGGGT
jgi:hypothetical protein